jgi:hypothetical protein
MTMETSLADPAPMETVISRRPLPPDHPSARARSLAAEIDRAFEDASHEKGKILADTLSMEGMSGRKYRYFINNLIERLAAPRYLEIGVCAGSTFCSAVDGNKVEAIASDNWTQFGGTIEKFQGNLSRQRLDHAETRILSRDFRDVDYKEFGGVDIYFYDGPHEERDHYDSLRRVAGCLKDPAIYIVDDWNLLPVRKGTKAAMEDLGFKAVHEIEIRTTPDGRYPKLNKQHSDWHNGYWISLVSRS